MGIIQSILGTVEAELTSADMTAALAAVMQENITLYDMVFQSEICVRFRVDRRSYKDLARLSGRRGDTLKLVKRNGIYWPVKELTKRPVLLVGLTLLLLFMCFLPGRILFVQVEGNVTVPDRLILAAAEEFGLCFGANRREVRSEEIKNQLLEAVPQLRWAGVNTYGCVAVISVSERSEPEQVSRQEMRTVSSIVADRDGVILSVTATQGSLQCRPGQAVKAGEVLISGYTDCGICIQGTHADGEVFAQTNREITAITPSEYSQRGGRTDVNRKISVIFGKKRINLWKDSGIYDTVCDRMYEEYYITLPGGFRLPVCIAVETYVSCEFAPVEADFSSIEAVLKGSAERCLRQQMIAGSIIQCDQTVTQDAGVYRLDGIYVCTEMIGKQRQEEIGEYNGKDS